MSETEAAVGITEFANNCPGFTGILKHRYADFKVNEVNLEGQVVHLTSTEAPPKAAPAEGGSGADLDPAAAVEAAVQQYAAASGSSDLEPLKAFLQAAQSYQAAAAAAKAGGRGGSGEAGRGREARVAPPQPLTLPPLADKAARTAVHKLFKSLPGSCFPGMETNTVETSQPAVDEVNKKQKEADVATAAPATDGAPAQKQQAAGAATGRQEQCIQVAVACRGGGGGGRGGGRGQKRKWRSDTEWAGGPGCRYVKFVLLKENMDAQQAISSLCQLLRVSHKLFAVAGTKDKRGVTVQQVTAFKLDPARLAGLNPRLRGMRVGNFEFCADQLRLGDLQGNRFELVLRNVEAESAEAVAAAAQGLRSSGFINYFGLQRFGTGAVPTHRVGQALLRGQWRDAVRLLLTPRADCPRGDQVEACRLYLEDGDVGGALRLMPRFLVAEQAMLQALKQHGRNGHLNALMCIPRNLRTMYIHAYQSYLWNAAASHRVKTYGTAGAVAGDLVQTRAAAAQRAAARNRGQKREEAQEEPEVEAVATAAGEEADVGAGEEVEVVGGSGGPGEVHVVTAEEATAGTYSIEDVVLPMPGSETQMPEHATAEVYRQLAAADGVSLDSSPHGAHDFSITALAGAYRHVVFRPADLECEVLRYSHPDVDLALTELQVLQGRSLPSAVAPDDDTGGRFLGLRLAFTLPSSCYATMLIRELSKQPTGSEHHKGMTQQQAQQQEQRQQQEEGKKEEDGKVEKEEVVGGAGQQAPPDAQEVPATGEVQTEG